MAISKSEARKLAKDGLEMGANVIRGVVTIGPDGVKVDDRDIAEWLARYADSELILIAAPVGKIAIESAVKTCYTCGRDYTGDTCPHCAEARARSRQSSIRMVRAPHSVSALRTMKRSTCASTCASTAAGIGAIA